MSSFTKYAMAAAMTGALAVAAATPSEARNGRNAAAAIGFGAGALVGAAVASSANNSYYYGEPRYYYAEPGYYAYEPAPVYSYRGRGGRVIDGQRVPSCATDGGYGKIDYSAC